MKKIGILGGTFDPIHYGHLLIAENAYEQFGLSEIWVIPTGLSPHKNDRNIHAAECRMEMVRLAIEDNAHMVLSKDEVESGEVNYTFRTLEVFKDRYPDYEFYFILGADSLETFSSWVHPEIISRLCIILAACRNDLEQETMKKYQEEYEQMYQADIRMIEVPNFSISSSNIRDRIKNGSSVKYMLPDKVISYIEASHLYS